MTRRRRPAMVETSDVDAEWRYRWLGRFLTASEADSPASVVSSAIRAEQTRLDRAGGSLGGRLAALEGFLAECGWLDGAERLLAHLQRATLTR